MNRLSAERRAQNLDIKTIEAPRIVSVARACARASRPFKP